jgi:hypothetical protein
MPDPLLYLKAMGASAIVSATLVLAMAWRRRPAGPASMNLACVLGMGAGLAVGDSLLGLQPGWPPVNGLDRLMRIVVPAALGLELVAGFPRVPASMVWFLRASLAAAVPRILLHGSVYLTGTGSEWTPWQLVAAWIASSLLLIGCWSLLCRLSQRSAGVSIPLALGLATLCAGATIMMAGYIKGGAAALPVAATIAATAISTRSAVRRSVSSSNSGSSAIIGIGSVSLFGLLFVGRFFGRLSSSSAVVMLLAPLLCWVTELPSLRQRKPWFVGMLRVVLVAIPLAVVLAFAKLAFDRDMAPLLGQTSP